MTQETINKIRVAILDDHQGMIDGYLYRLSGVPEIQIVATLLYGEGLEPVLEQYTVDVLILDVQVPTGLANPAPYPILFLIPKLMQIYPEMKILVITMHAEPALIHALMKVGASGYILKEDQSSIRELAPVIRAIAGGGIHLSQAAYNQLIKRCYNELDEPLSGRQLEVLSLCAAYPDASTIQLARRMSIANSTLRNLLHYAYLKLGVRNCAAAVAKARQMGLITPNIIEADLKSLGGSES
jgi:DNA-binding NarL/FixJ family response regulator